MKLQRSTVVLVAIALLLGGVVLFTQARQSNPNRPTATSDNTETSPVFDFQESDVVALQIETEQQTVAFEQDDEGAWQMVRPTSHPAEEAAIAFLLSRLTTDGLLKTTTIEAANQAEFGLQAPFATVNLTLTDGTERTLILGAADFSGQNYYALIDPETFPLPPDAGDVEVAIITENIYNGIDRPLEEWKAVVDSSTTESDTPANSGTDSEASETDTEPPTTNNGGNAPTTAPQPDTPDAAQ